MKLTTLVAAFSVAVVFAPSAHATEHLRRHGGYMRHADYAFADRYSGPDAFASPAHAAYVHDAYGQNHYGRDTRDTYRQNTFVENAYSQNTFGGGPGARPRAWCGWQMRQLVGGDPGPEFNLARNWARWGHAGPPGVGAVVVWPHHVGKIVGQENGQWIIQSGNDGNQLRTRPLPISGAIAIRWG